MAKTKEKKETEQKLQEYEEKYKRALADFVNLQKREAQDKERIFEYSTSVVVGKTLPVLDSLESASGESKDAGYALIYKQLKAILEELGLSEMDSKVAEFDPHYHEAIEAVGIGEKEVIAEVIQKGYLFRGRVLRVAKVKVKRE